MHVIRNFNDSIITLDFKELDFDYIGGLAQDCGIFSALAMETLQFSTYYKPSMSIEDQ